MFELVEQMPVDVYHSKETKMTVPRADRNRLGARFTGLRILLRRSLRCLERLTAMGRLHHHSARLREPRPFGAFSVSPGRLACCTPFRHSRADIRCADHGRPPALGRRNLGTLPA